MAVPVRPPLLIGPAPSRALVWRRWLLGTFPGRALLIGLVIKAFTWTLEAAGVVLPPVLEAIDMVGSLALLFAVAYGLTRLAFWAKRRLLWRVRRKLILSYVFVGVVPVLLVITFFLLAGLLLFFNVSSYLVKSRLRSLTDQAQFLAQTTAAEVQRSTTAGAVLETLERRQAGIETRYPFVSIAVVPVSGLPCPVEPARAARCRRTLPVTLPAMAGPWKHLDAPSSLPKWVSCEGFSGLVAYSVLPTAGDPQPHTRLVMRAVALQELPEPTWAVVFDLPISSDRAGADRRRRPASGLARSPRSRSARARTCCPWPGVRSSRWPPDPLGSEQTFSLTTQRWVAFLDYMDWASGTPSDVTLAMRINAWSIYDRLSAGSASVGELNFGQLLLGVLALVGGLFLIIQSVALVIGLLLARQITGAVHDLFTGTQHLRNRDFAYAIPVRARDQLGELAESFNAMTGEVTTLLGEVAEKGRMEQEMHAAREIQQKLLPPAPLQHPRPVAVGASVNPRARWPGTTTTSCRSPTPCSAC